MKVIYLPVLICILMACKTSVINKKLNGSDSLVITFNAPDSDSVIRTVSTVENKAVKKLAGFLDGQPAEQFKCGYDGNMIFYKRGEPLLPVVFKFSEEGCRHFLFDMDNKVMSTQMSNEAVQLLKSLKEGREWY